MPNMKEVCNNLPNLLYSLSISVSFFQKFELMDHLYRQAALLQGNPHYFLFLSLLSQALLSFLKLATPLSLPTTPMPLPLHYTTVYAKTTPMLLFLM